MNALFGKFLQRDMDFVEVKFAGNVETIGKHISNVRFRDIIIINPRVSIVFLSPKKIKRNKIMQSGMSCLDYSKLLMYSGYYNIIQPAFKGRGHSVYTDTGTLSYIGVNVNIHVCMLSFRFPHYVYPR